MVGRASGEADCTATLTADDDCQTVVDSDVGWWFRYGCQVRGVVWMFLGRG